MTYAELKAREVLSEMKLDCDEFGVEWPLPSGFAYEVLRALHDAGLQVVDEREIEVLRCERDRWVKEKR